MKSEILEKAYNIVLENKIIKGLCLFLGVGTAGAIGASIVLPSFIHIFLIAILSGIFVITYALIIFCILLIYFYLPKAISWKGIIHRAEFIIVVFVVNAVAAFSRVLLKPQAFNLEFQPTTFWILISLVICFFMMYLEVCAYIKRLNDLKWSKWLSALAIIPFISFVLFIFCAIKKSQSSIVEAHSNGGNNNNV